MFTASWDGKVSIGLLNVVHKWARKFDIVLQTANHLVPLDYARNWGIAKFLQTDCTHFLGVDTDIVPVGECLERLVEENKDCISPVIFTTKPDTHPDIDIKKDAVPVPVPIIFRKTSKGLRIIPPNGKKLMDVDLAPGGMFLVKRKVIESIKKPAFKYKYHRNGVVIGGTDVYFSERLQKHGYKIHIHTKVFAEQWIDIGAKSINDTMVRYSPRNIEEKLKELIKQKEAKNG